MCYWCDTGVFATRIISVVSRITTQEATNFAPGISCSFIITVPTGFAVYLNYSSWSMTGGLWNVYDGSTITEPLC